LALVKEVAMKRSIALATVLAVVAVGAAAHAGASPAAHVTINHFAFEPAQLSVAAGTTVTWVNNDEEAHTVTALDRSYASAGLEHEEAYTHRFATPGTYTYFCALHPHMTATVVVR
jgi:plastocyanin